MLHLSATCDDVIIKSDFSYLFEKEIKCIE